MATTQSRIIRQFYTFICLIFLSQLSLTFNETYSTVLVILVPLAIFFTGDKRWFSDMDILNVACISTLLFLIFTIAPQLFRNDILLVADSIRKFHLKFLGLLIVFLYGFQKGFINHQIVIYGLLIAFSVSVLAAYFGYFAPDTWHPWVMTTKGFPGSISPFGRHKNHYGLTLSYFIPFMTACMLNSFLSDQHSTVYKISLFTLVLLSFPVLVWTQSRGSQASVMAGLFLLTVVLIRNLTWKKFYLFLVFLIIFLGLVTVSVLFTQAGDHALHRWTNYKTILSLQGRIGGPWEKSIEFFKENPIVGHGFEKKLKFGWLQHEHNVFLFYLVRSGILGLIGFLILVAGWVYDYLRELFSEDIDFINLGIVVSLISAVVINGIVTTMGSYWFFWTFLSIWICNHLFPTKKRLSTL